MSDEQKMEIMEPETDALTDLIGARKKRGMELAGAGVGTFILTWVAANFAPLALGAYGLFRMVTGRSKLEGGFWLTLAVGLYIAMPLFWPLMHIVKGGGMALIAIGLYMVFKPAKA